MSQLHHTSARLHLWQNGRNCLAGRIILPLLDRRKPVYRLKKQLHQIVQNPFIGFEIVAHLPKNKIHRQCKFPENSDSSKKSFSRKKISRKRRFSISQSESVNSKTSLRFNELVTINTFGFVHIQSGHLHWRLEILWEGE